MAEYIEKQDVISKLIHLENELGQYTPFHGFEHAMYRKVCEAEIEIGKISVADVAPVRRGHWVRVGDGTTCSECMQGLLRINGKQSEWVDLSGMPYCPNCGADMREVLNDD